MHISKRLQEPYRSSFIHIYEEMSENTGVGFGQVFGEHMGDCLRELPVTEEDKTVFLSLFPESGFEDNNMQVRTIEQSGELLLHTIERLDKENVEKCRMAVGLGAMSGLLLLIVLL